MSKKLTRLKNRGIVTTVYGEMGTGKTQLITSMALSAEIQQREDPFEILLEKLQYPSKEYKKEIK